MIHQFRSNGYNIVLDVCSGSIHAVDDIAYDAVKMTDDGLPTEKIAARLAEKYPDYNIHITLDVDVSD